MPRRYKQGADGQPHPAFYGKLPEEFSKADTMRFMVETDLKLSGCVSADTLAALRAEGYDYKDGNLVPAGKEETMQEKTAGGTPAAPYKAGCKRAGHRTCEKSHGLCQREIQ